MFAKDTSANTVRLALPALSIVIAYVLFSAMPQYRQRQQIHSQTQQTAAAVEMLQSRLTASVLDHSPNVVRTVANQRGADESNEPSINNANRSDKPTTAVAAFAEVLKTFRSHGVQCVSATPQTEAAMLTYRVALQGDFGDVLVAMNHLSNQLPQAVASDFSMQRPPAAPACQWEFTFQFIPEIP